MLLPVALTLASYLIGSIPFGLLIGRLVRGIDIREHGSGNIGATNVGRVLGANWGVLALLVDFTKGAIPAGLLPFLLTEDLHSTAAVGFGVVSILGHIFPCWLGFRGGKGMATAVGVVVCIAPLATVVGAVAFGISFAANRIVSLSSIVATVVFGIAQIAWFISEPFSRSAWPLTGFSIAAPLLIILRHRSNIVRIFRGEEKVYRTADAQPPPSGQ